MIIKTSGTHSAFMAYSGGWSPCWAPHIIDLPVWALDLGDPSRPDVARPPVRLLAAHTAAVLSKFLT